MMAAAMAQQAILSQHQQQQAALKQKMDQQVPATCSFLELALKPPPPPPPPFFISPDLTNTVPCLLGDPPTGTHGPVCLCALPCVGSSSSECDQAEMGADAGEVLPRGAFGDVDCAVCTHVNACATAPPCPLPHRRRKMPMAAALAAALACRSRPCWSCSGSRSVTAGPRRLSSG